MSSDLTWLLVRSNSSFIVKKRAPDVILSREPVSLGEGAGYALWIGQHVLTCRHLSGQLVEHPRPGFVPLGQREGQSDRLYTFDRWDERSDTLLFSIQFVSVDAQENGVAISTRDATKNPRGIASAMKVVNLKRGTSARKAASIASNAASKTRPDLRSVRSAPAPAAYCCRTLY